MFPHLKSARVNLQLLQEAACRQLVQQLTLIEGSKVIVLDDAMIGPLGLITKPKLFSDRGIRLLPLKPEIRVPKEIRNIIYILRPQVSLMETLVTQVKANMLNGRQFHLYFVPRLSCLCIKQLENKDVLTAFGRIDELPWNFFPLEYDVVSMEMPHSYREVTIEGDFSCLFQAATGLVQLQRLYGRIPKIYGKGVQAQLVWEKAKQLAIDEKTLYNADRGAIDQLILLDRGIDLMSTLATQLTYEGLIDEFYGIRQNQLSLPGEHFSSYNAADMANDYGTGVQERLLATSDRKLIMLHSGEHLYSELRNRNFNEVRNVLARKVREIQLHMSVSREDQSVQEIKVLVERLPQLMKLKEATSVHTTIAELIDRQIKVDSFGEDLVAEQDYMNCEDIDRPSAYIDDLIARRTDLRTVLRLICMQCAAGSGFKERVLTHYKRELVHVYGLEVLLTLRHLEKAGLIRLQTESRAYAVLRKTLRLTLEGNPEINPTDISYVHSFYAPLTARLVEHSLRPLGWQTLKSQITNLPGPTFEDFQVQLIGIGGRHAAAAGSKGDGYMLHSRRVVLVFIVGGITFAEIAALRFLAAQEDNNVEFLIASTKIINKHTFLDSLMSS
ncbi:car [Drosophila busckii]|uniref:Car n=1 Tax=Drosophila busckii TaxID=30019 RepID=A0A0M4EVZ8_DROBS|nr:vacuolar protein sorting-associated protein 33A [Drosophila busckii]ALC49535.1 car [Drosophila busckii]